MTSGSEKSYLSPDLQITGEIRSSGDIEVNGAIEGEISCRNLTIGQEAAFQGQAIAEQVQVHGSLKGRIRAESVALNKTAKVEGEILHRSLSVEPGAFLEGSAQRLEGESARPAPEEVAPRRAPDQTPERATGKAGRR